MSETTNNKKQNKKKNEKGKKHNSVVDPEETDNIPNMSLFS